MPNKTTPVKRKEDHTYDALFTLRSDLGGDRSQDCGLPKGRISLPTWSDGYPNYADSKRAGLWTSEEELAMYGKMAAQVGSGFNLATFLGEGRESLQTIATSATRIYKSIKAAKKGNVLKAWNELRGTRTSTLPSYVKVDPGKNRKNLADNWLQLQYGWKPLLEDIYKAMKHLAYTQNRDFTKVYRVRHGKDWEGDIPIGSSMRAGGSVSCRRTIVAKVTSINQASLLGLSNPSATAWELLPWSFVADWFIPVSSYLEAINLRAGLQGKFVISYKDRSSTFSIRSRFDTAPYVWEDTYFNATRVQAGRVVASAMPSTSLPKVKDLSEVITYKRALNAVALIVSRAF